jgi:hypothetical protein
MEAYPKPKLLIINSWIVVITWFFGAIFLISVLFVVFGIGQAFFGLLAFIPLFVFALLHIALSFKLRCPACNKMITAQGFAPSHANARRRKYLNAWSTVVLDVLMKRNFVCIHCGRLYEV